MNLSFASLPYKLIALGAIIAALGAFHYIDKGHALELQEKAFTTRLEASMRASENKARLEEQKLAKEAVIKEQEKNEKLEDINAKQLALISSLSKRPTRPPDNSTAPAIIQACTGRELYKEDGEFLAREAARADKVIVERDFYYERYEYARELLAKQKPND